MLIRFVFIVLVVLRKFIYSGFSELDHLLRVDIAGGKHNRIAIYIIDEQGRIKNMIAAMM